MKLSELEKRLQKHAEIARNSMASPFCIVKEEFEMTKKGYSIKKTVLLAAAIICLLGITSFAAIRLLSPDEAARRLHDNKLAAAFEEYNFTYKTATDGDYTATLLGVASGKEISSFEGSAFDIVPERTYAVVAIEKSNNDAMTIGEPLMVSPLIQGLKPWEYNIASMHGSYTENVIDGVLYRIVEMDSIEPFADKKLYLAVTDSAFISNEHYSFDSENGCISPKESYSGTNILFEIELDKSKADAVAAERYLSQLKEGWKNG